MPHRLASISPQLTATLPTELKDSRLQVKHLLKVRPHRCELCPCRSLILLDERAVELELRLGTGWADGDPGAVLESILEQVRRRQVGDALGVIKNFGGINGVLNS